MFWNDLTLANGKNLNLIEGGYLGGQLGAVTGSVLASYIPPAKMGGNNYFYVWSGGLGSNTGNGDGINYFGLSAVSQLGGGASQLNSLPGLTVRQAHDIDTKIDDGLPQSGSVTALYDASLITWSGANPGTATSPSTTTCYDNGGNVSNPMQYSLSQNGGTGVNCALSFRFQ